MADADFDPFEEYDEESRKPPRVNLGYQAETEKNSKTGKPPPWQRLNSATLINIGKALLVLIVILGYPAMTFFGHQLNDRTVVLDDKRFWASPDIGVTAILIARELDGPGWIADRHRWHPQARLTALPAWQDAMLETLADHGRLLISQLEDQRDPDLIAAVRLLEPSDEDDMTARLMAAGEALVRYDDRVAAGVTTQPSGAASLIARLTKTANWANIGYSELTAVANPGDGWITSQSAIEAFYQAKARAHVAHEILAADARREQDLLVAHNAEAAMQEALAKWRRAASLRPMFVSNQASRGFVSVNHPAIMAFRTNEARLASEHVARLLMQPVEAPQTASGSDLAGPARP